MYKDITMPQPRKSLVSLDTTPYYHCTSRCVRRAFLCGIDVSTGKSYEYRRAWLEEHILAIGQIFAVEICSYVVMSNHYHVVLKIDRTLAQNWSDHEVIQRWTQLFTGSPLLQSYQQDPSSLTIIQRDVLSQQIDVYRQRLYDLSWFMRCLNEPIARQANIEDDCRGHFWESRFKSQALLDEAALISAMAYVDLNPVRANMAETPEQSDYTSIQTRLQDAKKATLLKPFIGTGTGTGTGTKNLIDPDPIPCDFNHYLQLLDWTGRAILPKKKGFIAEDAPPILARLNINATQWIKQHHQLESHYPHFMGHWQNIQKACHQLKRHWAKGKHHSQLLFSG